MKKVSRWIAAGMLVAAALFVWYALRHPEASFPWPNTVTYTIYGVYTAVMATLFVAPWK